MCINPHKDFPNLTEDFVQDHHDDVDYLKYLNQKASKMKELKGNLWEMECDAVCISTNGFIKNNGECVMGRGCAKEAAEFFPEIPKLLGDRIKKYGNVVQTIRHFEGVAILSYPVKPEMNPFLADKDEVVKHMRDKYKLGDQVPGWACVALINIIEQSAKQLVELADRHGWKKVLIPQVGCGAGELNWSEVKPILDKILDDRFTAVTFK